MQHTWFLKPTTPRETLAKDTQSQAGWELCKIRGQKIHFLGSWRPGWGRDGARVFRALSSQPALPGRSHPNPELHIVLVLQHLYLLALLLCTDAALTLAKLGSKEGSLSGG